MKLLRLFAAVLLLATGPVLETACSAPATRIVEVQSLKSVGQSAEAAVALSAQLYQGGRITGAQARAVLNFYDTKFQPAYRVAVSAVQSDLDSLASPEVAALAAQLSALVLQLSRHPS